MTDRLVQARIIAGVDRAEFARQLGVGVRSVQRWEAGATRPRESTLVRIAEVAGVSLAWLYGFDDEPKAA